MGLTYNRPNLLEQKKKKKKKGSLGNCSKTLYYELYNVFLCAKFLIQREKELRKTQYTATI